MSIVTVLSPKFWQDNIAEKKPVSTTLLTLGAVVAVLTFWVAAYGFCGLPIFETNDDVVQSMLSGGAGFSTWPNEHLPYTHYLLGLCLKHLYTANRQISWYGLYLVLAQIFSSIILITFLSRKSNTWKTSALVAGVFLVGVCLRPCLLLQFSTTAALTTSAGSVLLLEGLTATARHKFSNIVAGLTLIVFGSLIRYESALMVLILTAFAIFAKTVVSKDWKQLLYGAICTAGAVLIVLALWSQNSAYYDRTEGWNEYYKHNPHAFSLMVGKRISCENPKARAAMKKAGWLPIDLEMFRAWAYLDKKIYSTQNLSAIDETAEKFNPITVPGLLLYFRDHLVDPTLLPTHLTLLATFCILCLRSGGWKSTSIYLVAVLAFMILLLATKYLPPHMYAALVSTSALFGIYFCITLVPEKLVQHRNIVAAVLICLVLASFVSCGRLRQRIGDIETRSQYLLRTLRKLAPTADKALICWGAVFPYELVRPLEPLSRYFSDLHLIGMNWMVRTPVNRASIAAFGIRDLFNELDKPGLLMAANEYVLATVKDFTEQHYGKTPLFEKVIDDPTAPIEIYKVKYIPLTHKIASDKTWKYFEQEHLFGTSADTVSLPLPSGTWVPLNMVKIGKQEQSTVYKNTSAWPTLSYFGPLSLRLSDFSGFYIEAGPSDWIVYGRGAHIQLRINDKEQKSFPVIYGAGSQLRPYSVDLDSLNLLPTDKITHINIVLFDGTDPYGKDKKGDTITVGRVGFIRRQAALNR